MTDERKIVQLIERNDNSASWSAEDMLQAALEDVRSGNVTPNCGSLIFWEEPEEGRLRPVVYHLSEDTHTFISHLSLLLHRELGKAWNVWPDES